MDWKRDNVPSIVVENCGYEGVRRIAGKVAKDILKVLGEKPEVITEEKLGAGTCKSIILCVTLGKSSILEDLIRKGVVDPGPLYKDMKKAVPKREVYLIQRLSCELFGPEEILLICGSDKRGTIYGLFSLSEYIGVSPLCYWGDVEPVQKSVIHIGQDIEIVSRCGIIICYFSGNRSFSPLHTCFTFLSAA